MEKNSAALRPRRLANRFVVNEAILEIVCSLGESALHSRELQRGHPPLRTLSVQRGSWHASVSTVLQTMFLSKD